MEINASNISDAVTATSMAGTKHAAIAAGSGLTLAAIIVMAMTAPSSKREFFVALLSTVASSVFGGAWVIQYFNLIWLIASPDAGVGIGSMLMISKLGGVFFVSGLPGWVVIRAAFITSERRKRHDIMDYIYEFRRTKK